MTLLLFIVILGVIICIHELGHFLFAKLAGIYVYEYSIGMGPKLFQWKSKKGETTYSIRLIPIGGFCSLAGEGNDDDAKIPKDRLLQNKTVWQRFLTMFFGPGFNFILAIILLFFIGLVWGAPNYKPVVAATTEGTPAYQAGLEKGDYITKINEHNISTLDDVSIYLTLADHEKPTVIEVKKENGTKETYRVIPEKKKQGKETTYVYGIALDSTREYGIVPAIKYTGVKTVSLFKQMGITIGNLFTGGVKLSQLSGPVGIYNIVGEQSKGGLANILYLMAFLSINVGFLNLLPIPAFDGGRILFLIIEKIKGSPVKPETENMIHNIGFFLLIALMIYITFNDIFKLF